MSNVGTSQTITALAKDTDGALFNATNTSFTMTDRNGVATTVTLTNTVTGTYVGTWTPAVSGKHTYTWHFEDSDGKEIDKQGVVYVDAAL